ncbi:MAG: elongation factor Ts [Crocinitomicaceae bacterium]|nr:elongation factor Ts [Crocinitomicaceae bacterium]|tara:strand:- start:781 stop:1608 length:828 start_codon:yes stop_codon:yes gene_type:complete
MGISAKDVNELRKKTGSGMMDCKKALEESNGDLQAAIDFLRKKGQKIAAKRGDRDAKEGLVIAKTTSDNSKGVLICLNCETDFVAKNEDFGKLANTIASIATDNTPSNVDELLSLSFDGNGLSIGDKITEQTGVIGEKIEISGYELVEAVQVVAYNHPGNQIATIVGMNNKADDEGKQVAMQVAAMNPIALDKDSVPQEVIDREIEVGKELAIQEGKPAEMAEKIAMGRLNKFFKETTLMNQVFIRDNKKTVQQFLKETSPDLSVTDFKRISLSI